MNPDYQKEPYVPITPVVTSVEGARSADAYRACRAQFDVCHNTRRYGPAKGATYCNIFVWDVTKAMGCEIPHWVDNLGNPAPQGQGREMRANDFGTYLTVFGRERGWRESESEADVIRHVLQGKPAVAVYTNPEGHGHVAMLWADPLDKEPKLRVAQAGFANYENVLLSVAFGKLPRRFFCHE